MRIAIFSFLLFFSFYAEAQTVKSRIARIRSATNNTKVTAQELANALDALVDTSNFVFFRVSDSLLALRQMGDNLYMTKISQSQLTNVETQLRSDLTTKSAFLDSINALRTSSYNDSVLYISPYANRVLSRIGSPNTPFASVADAKAAFPHVKKYRLLQGNHDISSMTNANFLEADSLNHSTITYAARGDSGTTNWKIRQYKGGLPAATRYYDLDFDEASDIVRPTGNATHVFSGTTISSNIRIRKLVNFAYFPAHVKLSTGATNGVQSGTFNVKVTDFTRTKFGMTDNIRLTNNNSLKNAKLLFDIGTLEDIGVGGTRALVRFGVSNSLSYVIDSTELMLSVKKAAMKTPVFETTDVGMFTNSRFAVRGNYICNTSLYAIRLISTRTDSNNIFVIDADVENTNGGGIEITGSNHINTIVYVRGNIKTNGYAIYVNAPNVRVIVEATLISNASSSILCDAGTIVLTPKACSNKQMSGAGVFSGQMTVIDALR